MMRSILTLCCLGLLGGAIAAALPGTNGQPADSATNGLRLRASQPANRPAGDRCFDRQHSLPLLADADETDDTEELSSREKSAAAHYAIRHSAAGPSARAARFEAAIQHRLANTLNALGIRLQI